MTAEETPDSWPRPFLPEEHVTTQDDVLLHHIICSQAHCELPNER